MIVEMPSERAGGRRVLPGQIQPAGPGPLRHVSAGFNPDAVNPTCVPPGGGAGSPGLLRWPDHPEARKPASRASLFPAPRERGVGRRARTPTCGGPARTSSAADYPALQIIGGHRGKPTHAARRLPPTFAVAPHRVSTGFEVDLRPRPEFRPHPEAPMGQAVADVNRRDSREIGVFPCGPMKICWATFRLTELQHSGEAPSGRNVGGNGSRGSLHRVPGLAQPRFFENPQVVDREALIGRVLSTSYAPLQGGIRAGTTPMNRRHQTTCSSDSP